MVTAGRTARWPRRALAALGNDLRWFSGAVGGRRFSQPGLFTYDLTSPGGRRRLHLRVASDSSAVLLIDAANALHLNPTAALLVRCALEGVSVELSAAVLRSRFRNLSRHEATAQSARFHALVERLIRAGPCVGCELGELQRAAAYSLPISAPYKADLALSYQCNNACSHCYNNPRSPLSSLPSPLSPTNWLRVLDRLAAIGIPQVVFTGGEPTLFEDLPALIRYAANLRLVVGLNTNGRRLSDPRLASCLRTAGLDHVQITVESHNRAIHNAMTGADSFDETIAGVRNCLAVGLHTITNTTLMRRNIDQAGQLADFLHSLGLQIFAVNGMIYSGGGLTCGDGIPPEQLAPVLIQLREQAAALGMRFLWYTPTEYCRFSPVECELGPRRCNAAEYSICIEPNGDVLPCQSYYTPAGNLLTDPWEKIWNSELFLKFRRRQTDPRGSGLPERCWNCPDLSLCAGGCPLERRKYAQPNVETSH